MSVNELLDDLNYLRAALRRISISSRLRPLSGRGTPVDIFDSYGVRCRGKMLPFTDSTTFVRWVSFVDSKDFFQVLKFNASDVFKPVYSINTPLWIS